MNERNIIICLMGHVDHGKTSLIETLSGVNIKDSEIGNITQYIKTYIVNINNEKIVFIDSPGHDSFNNMRKICSNISDLIILVISADDGVQNQTLECINYIKNNNINYIIVINKIDKGYHNVDNIKKILYENNLLDNNFSNEIIYTSIFKKESINLLINKIFEKKKYINLNVKNDKFSLNAFVIDSYIDNNNRIILFTIVKNGYICVGDYFVCNNTYGKIKFIKNQFNENIKCTVCSLPCKIFGSNDLPDVNDKIIFVKNLKEAKYISNIKKNNSLKLNNLVNKNVYDYKYINFDKINKINLIFKIDTYRSYEAIFEIIKNISFIYNKDNIILNVLYYKVGNINENDINYAFNSNSKILGYNIFIKNSYIKLIKEKKIEFHNFNIIYDLKKYLYNSLKNNNKDKKIYKSISKVIKVFSNFDKYTIIGCKINYGKIKKNSIIKIFRNDLLLYDNCNVYSLKILKKTILEAKQGSEYGMLIKGKYNIQKGDIIISY